MGGKRRRTKLQNEVNVIGGFRPKRGEYRNRGNHLEIGRNFRSAQWTIYLWGKKRGHGKEHKNGRLRGA